MHTLASPLKHALNLAPDKVAVVHNQDEFTYAQLHERCARLINVLRSLKLQKGDRVAILAANCVQYIEVYVGVPAAGLVVVPLNTRHAQAELSYALKDSGARVLITDRDPEELADLVEHVIWLPDEYEDMISNTKPCDFGNEVQETDLAGLFYTGGTTGASKGVMLSHRNLIANTYHWLVEIHHIPEDIYMVMAPMFHAAGSNSILGSIWRTAKQVTLPSFHPGTALDLIERYQVTHTLGVPTMLAAVAEEQLVNPRDTSTLKGIGHGGSPIATEILQRVHKAMPTAEIFEVYGATELSPLATTLRHEEKILNDARARSCGRPVSGCEIRILSADDQEMVRGEIGELVIRGPNVMQGYWNKPEQTAEVLKGEWYRTGDLGYMDAEGYVYLVDRSKDMIVSGGENVYCTEVEEVLYQHPAVLQAAVFGVPDDKWGEAVQGVLVLRDGHESVTAEDIIGFCRQSLAGYKLPKGIEFRSEPLPVSGPGKILKRKLRAPYWETKGRLVN